MSEYRLGLDVGSTTVKVVILDDKDQIVFSRYRRHLADVRGELLSLMEETARACGDMRVRGTITGSGGLAVADLVGLPFVQEVVMGAQAVKAIIPEADVVLELGGEDAKITYMKPTLEQRMNGTCAGGTGAFIDQMASLLATDAAGLNEYARTYETIYPIAARCGVFAKTDIQPLINDGAAKGDIAISVLQAVVNQTISGLACGRPIRGKVAFLGGPLHYLPELRARFIETLHLAPDEVIHPENSHLFVAMGAALIADGDTIRVSELPERMRAHKEGEVETRRLAPLFADASEVEQFRKSHEERKTRSIELEEATGPLYFGLDAGSTTIKAVLLDGEGRVAYRFYKSNDGTPLDSAADILGEIYERLPKDAYIAGSCVTGYGEGIIKEALRMDMGEVETVTHLRAAREFLPDVDFVIDIGGQDMKCLRIRNDVIDQIMLNEACSSGCGSFIETFANSMGYTAQDFAQQALLAQKPVDLGTRCTVFMNSRVKQAQKEGAGVPDISSGLAYSVVKNALYKVIKVKSAEELGSRVVVQGGTFKNDAVLRAFEKELGVQVVRPDIAECMGAYGAALLARENAPAASTILRPEELAGFSSVGRSVRCGKCANNCMLTVTTFQGNRKFISGNRCERGSGQKPDTSIPNLFDYKLKRVFGYEPLAAQDAPRGEIGIPRALNMYEDYPFWFTLLTKLGFRVVLSDPSTHGMIAKAMDTIPSESVCYPAKLAHGHIVNLVEKGVRRILYPCVPYERKEYDGSNNHYSCPIVTSYPELIRNNVGLLQDEDIDYMNFFIALDNPDVLPRRVFEEFSRFGVTRQEAKQAAQAAYAELEQYKKDVEEKGEQIVQWLKDHNRTGIVLAGRPYHLDPEINHGIPELITSYGFAVLTEDSVARLGELERPIRVMDQWAYHTRLYEAAAAVVREDCLELVQLNSFGCGLDAIVADEVREILEAGSRIYTLLKIDEISNLGAIKIRLRSLLAAMQDQQARKEEKEKKSPAFIRKQYTREMRKTGKIVCPQLAPLQFQFLKQAFDPTGYDFEVLTEVTKEDIDVGLKYVNNDACYPTIIVVGQLVNAFMTGRLDPDNTTVLLTQTGGGCRASNYLAFLRKALIEAGYPQVVVASINFAGLEKNPGLKFTGGMAVRLLIAISMGDLLQRVMLATRPYEKKKGETDELVEKWTARIQDITSRTAYSEYKKAVGEMVREFDAVERTGEIKPKVGLVGEILVKYHPDANNHAIEVIEGQGGECVMPALMEFLTYGLRSTSFAHDKLGTPKANMMASKFGIRLVNSFRKPIQKALEQSVNFEPFPMIDELLEDAHEITCEGHCTGEGWFLTAEMVHLIKSGAPNVLCVQPFACLPNHVVAKGMLRAVRAKYPQANIVTIDYDPGASEVNQLNRIKLMLYNAKENLQKRLRQQAAAGSVPDAAATGHKDRSRNKNRTLGASQI